MTSDGGAVAAYGFRRQYLVTAEEILRLITRREIELDQRVVIIEPTRIDLASTGSSMMRWISRSKRALRSCVASR